MAEKKTDYAAQAVKDLQYRQRQKQQQNIPALPGTPGNGLHSPQAPGQNLNASQGAQWGQPGKPRYMEAGASQPAPPPDSFGQGMQRQMAEPARQITGAGTEPAARESAETLIDSRQVQEWTRALTKYKAGKASLERRVISAERWWKLRNQFEADKMLDGSRGRDGKASGRQGFQAATAWLHNVITAKHADALEAYPSPNILPREEGDKVEAWALSHIVPVVLRQNDFEATYDSNIWQKLKTGTGVYKVIWDNEKLNGLGDISVRRVDLLNIFWEPGVTDIQQSKYLFHTELIDKEELKEKYPDKLTDKVMQSVVIPSKFPADDSIDTTDKVVLIDVYYKKHGRLHYCKYVGDVVLYATENDPERRDKGLYDHGRYPFVFDTLFPIEGSPAGYGYVDICANPQTRIDIMNSAMLKNTMAGATPRYFTRTDGAINEEEFLDLNNALVHVNGALNEDSLRLVDYKPLSGSYINFLNSAINELRETSSNTETSTGSSTNGVTAAAALAALQEAAGKTSRASTNATYRAYTDIVYLVIELIRQFYDMPRQFRITGRLGVEKYITFTNEKMQPQYQGMIGDLDLGYRIPIYDIKVEPEKRSSYTRIAQNELAIQLYSLGMFNPQMTDQALMCLDMMDFDGKDELMQKIAGNGTMFQRLQLYKAMAATLAAKHEPEMVSGLLGGAQQPEPKRKAAAKADLDKGSGEAGHVSRARERAATANQPGGSSA